MTRNEDSSRHLNRSANGHQYSRRKILKTAGAGIGSATFGGASGTAAAGTAVERCGDQETIDVAPTFTTINNTWSTTDVTQCIFLDDDEGYGWHWERGSTDSDSPNYPQVLCGRKPWGKCTGSAFFPRQRGEFAQFDLALSKRSTYDKTEGEWNLAEEWWLTDVKPECGTDVSDHITHEVLLMLEWSDQYDLGTPIESDAIEDAFGNTIDYWSQYERADGDAEWSFHVFRIAANAVPSKVDLTAIMDYMSDNAAGVSPDLWVSGIEVGNEYWDDTSGSLTWDWVDVTVDGSTETSGEGRTQSPYGRTSGWPIPGAIEAEDFDEGGQGVAYYDATSGNEGRAYRATDVDVQTSTENGYNVGWIDDGEWLEYTVDVGGDGTYALSARVASDSGGAFHVDVDGSQVASVSFSDTGGWQNWRTVSLGNVQLAAGERVVRITADRNAWNLNRFEFARNLLANPGFEDDATGWWSNASFATVSEPVYGGAAAGEASDRRYSWMGIRQDVTDQLLGDGEGTYDVSGFVRLGSGSDGVKIVVRIDDDDGTSYVFGDSVTVDDASWTEVAHSLSLSWNGLDAAELYFETDDSLADLYVDDAVMTFDE